jgi:iron complex outermembrane recepter protein
MTRIFTERRRIWLSAALGSGIAAVLPSSPAIAQASAVAESVALEADIVITATRRAESLQNVPQSVSALGTERLEQLGAVGFEDFARLVPGLTFNASAAGNANFAMRGIATETSTANLQSTVALYINDLPTLEGFAPIGVVDLPLFDIARVEVLRGPQGTLFGSGSLGGAIRVITNPPRIGSTEGLAEGRIATTKGGDVSFGINGMVNVPIGERAAVRAVASFNQVGGVIDNVTLGIQNQDRVDSVSARIAGAFEATETLKLTASLLYDKSDPKGSTVGNDNSPVIFDPVVLEPYQTNSLSNEYVRSESWIANLVVDWDLDFAELFSSTSYGGKSIDRLRDFGELDSPLAVDFTGTPVASPEIADGTVKTFAQEIRLASAGNDRFTWLAGFFYVNRDRDLLIYEGIPGFVGSGFERPDTQNIIDYSTNIKESETALFGELAYRVTDAFRIAVSGRYFWNSITQTYDFNWAFGPQPDDEQKSKDNGFTPRVVLEFKPSDAVLTYASYARGYRVGGPNIAIVGLPAFYGPDTIDAFELGVKSQFLDRRITLNVAAFYNKWKDIQVNEVIGGLAAITNGPRAYSKGIEIEASARPVDGLSIAASAAFTDARADSDAPGVNANRGGIAEGDRLPGSAKVTTSAVVRYETGLSDTVVGHVQLAHQYVGGSYNGFETSDPLVKYVNPRHKVDFRAGANFGSIELEAYVDNLFNSDRVTNILFNGGFQRDQLARIRPRTVGLLGRVRF